MAFSDTDRLLALAGLFQAAWCAQRIARHGLADTAAMEASIYSLFQTDAADVPAVFGGADRVTEGLRQLAWHLRGVERRDLELTRHLILLLKLERRLAARPALLQQLAEGLDSAQARLAHFHLLHGNILAQLADLYVATLATLPPRIIVRGEALHLRNPDNQHKIRALLLAGVRAARLWRQVGGRRRQILLQRSRLIAGAEALLRQDRD